MCIDISLFSMDLIFQLCTVGFRVYCSLEPALLAYDMPCDVFNPSVSVEGVLSINNLIGNTVYSSHSETPFMGIGRFSFTHVSTDNWKPHLYKNFGEMIMLNYHPAHI